MSKERAGQFLKLVSQRNPKSYREIGELFGVTKQLVCLELKKYYPEETKEALAKTIFRGGKKRARPFLKFTCLNCGKVRTSKYRYHSSKFCDKKCNGEYVSKIWKTEE